MNVEVLAQSNNIGGGSSGGDSTGGGSSGGVKSGDRKRTSVHCVINGILIHEQSTNNSSGSAWGFNGTVSAGTPWAKMDLGGDFGKNASGSNSNYGHGNVSVSADFWADKYYCPMQTYNACTPYDPCIEALKEYRSLM